MKGISRRDLGVGVFFGKSKSLEDLRETTRELSLFICPPFLPTVGRESFVKDTQQRQQGYK